LDVGKYGDSAHFMGILRVIWLHSIVLSLTWLIYNYVLKVI
jgi:hypothetical protein